MSTDNATAALNRAVERATQRVSQLRARQLLRELRTAAREKEQARKALHRRALELGDAALEAGFGGWSYEEFLALLQKTHARITAQSESPPPAPPKPPDAPRTGLPPKAPAWLAHVEAPLEP